MRCPAGALRMTGAPMAVSEVVEKVEKDRSYYRRSGGGVTLSGGEPLAQPRFARDILRACYRANIHTAIETAGHVPWEALAGVLEFTDLVLYDIKHADAGRHRELTGVSNQLILQNTRGIADTGTPITIRVPLIPGCNSSAEGLSAIAACVSDLGLRDVHLLPYHQLARDKYRRLGREYPLGSPEPPGAGAEDGGSLERARSTFERFGLDVQIGG